MQDGVYDEFAKKFAEAVAHVEGRSGHRRGNGHRAAGQSGSARQGRGAGGRSARNEGANVLTGGKRHDLGRTFYEVTVLTERDPEMRIAHEEIFGPVAPLFRFSTEEEAITLANDTPFGLASYFYAGDIGRIWRVSEGLEYGMVGVNTGLMSTEIAPFGGFKESGIGREGSHDGLDEYLETKYVAIGGI